MSEPEKWPHSDGSIALKVDRWRGDFACLRPQPDGTWTVEPYGWTHALVVGRRFASEDEAFDAVRGVARSLRGRLGRPGGTV